MNPRLVSLMGINGRKNVKQTYGTNQFCGQIDRRRKRKTDIQKGSLKIKRV